MKPFPQTCAEALARIRTLSHEDCIRTLFDLSCILHGQVVDPGEDPQATWDGDRVFEWSGDVLPSIADVIEEMLCEMAEEPPVETRYAVRWEMEIEAVSPEAAARKALEIHRDPESIATCFQVHDQSSSMLNPDGGPWTFIDLMETDE